MFSLPWAVHMSGTNEERKLRQLVNPVSAWQWPLNCYWFKPLFIVIDCHIANSCIKCGYCYHSLCVCVFVCVCQSWLWALQKSLKGSRCRLKYGPGCVQGTRIRWDLDRILQWERALFVGDILGHAHSWYTRCYSRGRQGCGLSLPIL